ncbi:Dirigent protein [Dillenia turbinata]|uniref:Dirigent protein n=1 Tax=Dillenia turbinata TaxID=194707 RepID=A0AAN8UXB8_9MAGN
MAPNQALKAFTSLSIILLAISVSIEAKPQQKQTNIVFYMHDIIAGQNATAVAVAGIGNKPWKALEFDKSAIWMTMSLVFTNKKFNGSTLEIQGSDMFSVKPREVAVVSGTRKFRLAKGYALMETAFANLSTFNSILKWNVTVFHY